jgi:protoporphyrinogen oxidase
MGFLIDGQLFAFDGPVDLLRFRPLPLADRLRVGAAALYLTRFKLQVDDLDDIAAIDWLRRIFGRAACERLWEPLLRAKFGESYATIPAFWVWSMLNREKNGGPEVKGYLQGGYATLAHSLEVAIEEAGGEVRLGCSARAVEATHDALRVRSARGEEDFRAVVSTVPLPILAQLASGLLSHAVPLPHLSYQGVVNAVVVSRERLERFYWTVVLESSFPFQGVVETTHVIPPAWLGHRHLIYLMTYCPSGSPEYVRSDDLVRRQAMEGLSRLYKRFHAEQVEAVHVFRAPYVEPLWSLGYARQRPPARTSHPRLYACTTAQAYPRVTAWNTSVSLAREAVDALTQDHPRTELTYENEVRT